jgi:predicted MFS family arabinose efflux permease
LLAITVLVEFSLWSVYQTFIIYASQRLAYSGQQIGYFLSVMGLIHVITRSLLTERLAKYIGEAALLSVGILLAGLGAGLLPFSPRFWAIFAAMGLVAIGTPLYLSCSNVLLSYRADANSQGAVYGLDMTSTGLGAILGMLAAGRLYDLISPTAPFVVAGVFLAGGFLISCGLKGSEGRLDG